mgnify:CR=1 FL=1
MHLPTLSSRRLAGAAVLACAAVLIPVAALAATAAPATPGAASAPPCPTAGLVIWLTNGSAAAGTFYYDLNFTNLSGHACTLRGHPGVSAANLGGAGVRIQVTAPAPDKPWEDSAGQGVDGKITKGDVVTVAFWAKAEPVDGGPATATINWVGVHQSVAPWSGIVTSRSNGTSRPS